MQRTNEIEEELRKRFRERYEELTLENLTKFFISEIAIMQFMINVIFTMGGSSEKSKNQEIKKRI
jgi:hypothetical protein